ncbi:MAG TPA: alpha/beta hydrolase [Reyranella sp.]|nr:alpha/beta hydrolase [Reyranella sp.]
MDALPSASPAPAAVPPEVAAIWRPADRYGWLSSVNACLRYACWNASGTTRGTVIVLGGRGEFIEKYATEVMGELLDRGFAVMSLDWRGQGLSDRPLPAQHEAGHIDRFETYVDDLRLFIDMIVMPEARGPLVVLCHSMGAHIVTRFVAEQGGPFAAAVLCSPMEGLHNENFLRPLMNAVPELPAIDRRDLFSTPPFVWLARDVAANRVTHDERRFRWTEAWFKADPRLSLGGPTIGWARQAGRSMWLARAPGYLERIAVPTLLFSAGRDAIVDPAYHAPMAARLRNCRHVTIAEAHHEIMMETDDIRARFWAEFDDFVAPLPG